MNADKAQVLDCLARADGRDTPFAHWLLGDVLTERTRDGLLSLPFAPPRGQAFDGTRETDNQTRVFLSPDVNASHPACGSVAEAFNDPEVTGRIEDVAGIDLSACKLRIEYTQDRTGFWLEPHCDIAVKRFTMLVYLSREPELADAGTDLFDADHSHAGRAPYRSNDGMFFVPGADTWHGFVERPINGIRRSLIINYVTPDWRDRDQLA